MSILPAGVPILRGQVNRTPEPQAVDFVVLWELRRERIELNVDSYADVIFTGSISITELTISDILEGTVLVGATVLGSGVSTTTILEQTSGPPGGVGVYVVDRSQSISSRLMSAGTKTVVQNTKVVIQCDVHGPGGADNAHTIATLLRDDYGVQSFADQDPSYGVVPLFTEDPRQMPFINAEQQYEDRYVVEIALQSNQVISVPQQFADVSTIEVISVDAAFPPN